MANLEFDNRAFEDLEWWVEHDRRMALRIMKLIREVRSTPYEGTGQPEQLKHELSGCWSRRNTILTLEYVEQLLLQHLTDDGPAIEVTPESWQANRQRLVGRHNLTSTH